MQSPDATDQPDPHAALMRHFAENAEACMQTAQEGLFQLDLAAQLLADTVARGGKILLCGAAETAFLPPYLAARLGGVLERERPPLPALALLGDLGWPVANPAGTTQALPPDMLEQLQQGVAQSLVQQLQQFGQMEDTLWLYSTDARQPYALQALAAAHARDLPVLWMHGGEPSDALGELDVEVLLAQPRGLRLLEQCLLASHVVCDALDRILLGDEEEND